MAYLNQVFLIGNLTRDPEMRYTQGGTAICSFSLAVSRKYVQNGQEHEETCFVDITNMGKGAENISRFCGKGSPVLVIGRLKFDQWQDRNTGEKRSKISVIAERVQFLNPPPVRNERQTAPTQSAPPQSAPGHRYGPEDKKPDGIDDDIPF